MVVGEKFETKTKGAKMVTLREVVIKHDLLRMRVTVDGRVTQNSLWVTSETDEALPAELWHCSDYAVSSRCGGNTVLVVRRGAGGIPMGFDDYDDVYGEN